ncbi:stage II sporulation protein M [Candidatus Woesearchaeota archaeon]|nr:stage II sporulation protein M [Candidatus Woesearchaeota archaeon]
MNKIIDLINDLKNDKKLIISLTIVFFAGFIFGTIFENTLLQLQQTITDILLAKTQDYNIIELFGFILYNNLRMAFITILLGITIVLPFIILAFNGFIAGAIVKQKALESTNYVFLYLLPHGIFEIPAIIIASYLGVKLGLSIKKDFKQRAAKTAKQFTYIVLPLLLIAAIIETLLIALN